MPEGVGGYNETGRRVNLTNLKNLVVIEGVV
jgi:hypothetical protein